MKFLFQLAVVSAVLLSVLSVIALANAYPLIILTLAGVGGIYLLIEGNNKGDY